MRTILLLNAKGGCGKSTIACNLASYYVWQQEKSVALVDMDPQLSSLQWLAARHDGWPQILGMDGSKSNFRMPKNIDVSIIDAPARVHGKELSALINLAQTVIVPILPSPLDMRAAVNFIGDLQAVGKVSRKQVKLAVVANRVRENTLIYHKLELFLKSLKIPFITHLRDTQNYIRATDRGIGIFEMAPSMVEIDVQQWSPLVKYLNSKRSVANK